LILRELEMGRDEGLVRRPKGVGVADRFRFFGPAKGAGSQGDGVQIASGLELKSGGEPPHSKLWHKSHALQRRERHSPQFKGRGQKPGSREARATGGVKPPLQRKHLDGRGKRGGAGDFAG